MNGVEEDAWHRSPLAVKRVCLHVLILCHPEDVTGPVIDSAASWGHDNIPCLVSFKNEKKKTEIKLWPEQQRTGVMSEQCHWQHAVEVRLNSLTTHKKKRQMKFVWLNCIWYFSYKQIKRFGITVLPTESYTLWLVSNLSLKVQYLFSELEPYILAT